MLATTPYRMRTANYSLRFSFDLLGLALFVRVRSRAWFYKVLPIAPSTFRCISPARFFFLLVFVRALQVRHFCY